MLNSLWLVMQEILTLSGGRAAIWLLFAVCFSPACLLKLSVAAGFEAESEEEVTVSVGDEIIVHLEVEGWFQITRVADQTRGLVPVSYVQVN